MEKFKIEIEIAADTQEEAVEKMEAFQKITTSLDHEEFVMTANFIAENPGAIEQIKSWITEPPAWLKGIQKTLFKRA